MGAYKTIFLNSDLETLIPLTPVIHDVFLSATDGKGAGMYQAE